jgi:YegS/Rv2252/BmrU family lipid kinase
VASATNPVVIINPVAGSRGDPGVARDRAALAANVLGGRGLTPKVFLTEGRGHARELAAAHVAEGADTVVAWGGDGTVNEVATALSFTGAALGIVPSGSGNGLARHFDLPFDPAAALAAALDGTSTPMDAGELDERLFFNVAGAGLDARVAHRFGAAGVQRRGFRRYLAITLQELFTYTADECDVVVDGQARRCRALIIAFANARQYGNGAVIAPGARVDDGLLDVVEIDDRRRLLALCQVPQVFLGRIDRVRGVTIRQGREVTVTASRPIAYHVDGEPFIGGTSIAARIHPGALRVRTRAG